MLTWQSQPRLGFESEWIQQFIGHDERRTSIYLFLRTQMLGRYTYLGQLKYLDHDPGQEFPLWFHWQIIDWNPSPKVIENLGLQFQPADADEDTQYPPSKGLTETPPPQLAQGPHGTAKFKRRHHRSESNEEEEHGAIGRASELLALQFEKSQLIACSRPDLADCVVHTAVVEGDGAGYDILPYTPDEEVKHIEVKTTRSTDQTPFFVSPNEVRFSDTSPESFYLYRLYEIQPDLHSAKFYVVKGSLSQSFQLTPTEYRATFTPS